MGWLIGFIILGLLIYALSRSAKKMTERTAILKQLGFDIAQFVDLGQYISGHPKLSDPLTLKAYCRDNAIQFFIYDGADITKGKEVITEIPFDKVKNITIEDSSSMERRITLGRVLLVGVFALAWKKKKKNELAFLVIEWNDGRFDHETMFQFEGKDAMTKANTARNKLIEKIS